MSALRVVGGIFAVAFFALALIRYQRRRISRLNLIISSLISAVLLLLAIAPGLFNPLFEVFNFEPGNGQRLTAVLLFAVAIQFLLLIRMQSEVDTNERGIRQLVESFGQSAFDWERGGRSPRRETDRGRLPAFNEAENVGAVIDARCRARSRGTTSSRSWSTTTRTTGPADAAREAGALAASLPIRRGGGLALRVGYDIALKLGADIVVTMDADGQHQPEELPTVVGPIIEGAPTT